MNLILAWWDAGERQYTSYTTRQRTSAPESPNPGVTVTQAAADSGGTWDDIDLGHSIYTFKTVLPAGYDQTITTTLGIYATRNMTGILDKNYYANVEQDFVPNGARGDRGLGRDRERAPATPATTRSRRTAARARTSSSASCATRRRPSTPTRGNTVDFKVMIHKIHMGENLPSVADGTPY